MQIKIDPEKDSIEKLNIVAKMIEELKQSKGVKPSIKEISTEELENEELKENLKKKNIKLTKEELFLLKKYMFYLAKTLVDLSNRDLYEDEDDTSCQNKKPLDEVYIDKTELARCFINELKNANIYEPNPFIFERAIKNLENRSMRNKRGVQFHIEKMKDMYKVIF